MTPDRDIYPEQISLENDDISGFRLAVPGGLPVGLDNTNTYCIRQLPQGEEMAQYQRDARHAGLALLYPPGAAVAAAAPLVNAPVAAAAGMGDGVNAKWLLVESGEGRQRGEEVALDGSEIIHGDIGLKQSQGKWVAIRRVDAAKISEFAGKEASSDARLLALSFQETGREERLWRDVARDSKEEAFADWSIPEPRTTSWCVRYINRRNGGPSDHNRWWVSNNGLQPDSWGVQEHETLMKIVDKLGRFDGLDVTDASVMKQVRKAREERAAANK